MEFIIADILFSLLGRTILFVRYRDTQKIRQVLVDKYDNSYTQAGRLLSTLSIAWLLLLGIVAMILAAIYGYLRHNLHLF
jgi:hypothetical protein